MGSHLVDRLMLEGHEVTVVDNFFTGRKRNVEHWIGHENFELMNHDIVNPLFIEGKTLSHHITCTCTCSLLSQLILIPKNFVGAARRQILKLIILNS